MQKYTPSMFLPDFHMQKYTGGIISRVGIFLTFTPARPLDPPMLIRLFSLIFNYTKPRLLHECDNIGSWSKFLNTVNLCNNSWLQS